MCLRDRNRIFLQYILSPTFLITSHLCWLLRSLVQQPWRNTLTVCVTRITNASEEGGETWAEILCVHALLIVVMFPEASPQNRTVSNESVLRLHIFRAFWFAFVSSKSRATCRHGAFVWCTSSPGICLYRSLCLFLPNSISFWRYIHPYIVCRLLYSTVYICIMLRESPLNVLFEPVQCPIWSLSTLHAGTRGTWR